MDTIHLLSVSVTPVVLISACGLVMTALYSRMSAIVARIRAFHQQKIELLEDLDRREAGEQQTVLALLDSQITEVTVRAKLIQKGLYCLLFAVVAFLFSSLLAAVAVLYESVGLVALGMHVLGVSLFLVGMGWAIRELMLSLRPLEKERAYLETLTAQRLARSKSSQKIRAAKAA